MQQHFINLQNTRFVGHLSERLKLPQNNTLL